MNQELKDRVLTVAKRLAEQAITHAAGIPGNVSGKQREDVAVEFLEERATLELEKYDHLIPALARYMDLPAVDYAQRRAVNVILRAFIRRVYAEFELKRLAA